MDLEGKTILITGGTGSFGRHLARRLLEAGEARKVIVFSRDEWKQWEMQKSDPIFSSERIRYFLGDIRDRERLRLAFHGVDVVVHAAALKQVPVAEYNPAEFVKTNVNGSMNVIDAAIICEVEKVIALSSDKAINPINLYGATKLCAEKLFVAANVYVGQEQPTRFGVLRYGNVFASRGSVVPHWKELLASGAKELPVTDPEMTRFGLTLDQAVDLLHFSLDVVQGGEILVPKIPSFRITDLAEAMAPGLPVKVTGLRPAEKLAELLIQNEDAQHTRDCGDYYLIVPRIVQQMLGDRWLGTQAKALPADFEYRSDTNDWWLTVDELRSLVGEPS